MNSEQRERIVEDIVNHKIELEEVGGNGHITKDEIDEFRETVEEQSDETLENWWFSRVGEWVDSMNRWGNDEFRTDDDTEIWIAEGYENPAEWQYQKLLDGEPRDYGYINPL